MNVSDQVRQGQKGGEMRENILKWALVVSVVTTTFSSMAITAQTTPSSPGQVLDSGVKPQQLETSEQVSSQSAVIVREFSVNEKTGWPYDVKRLQSQSVAELKAKCGGRIDVLVGPPATQRIHTYTLEGEIVSWRPGSRAKRLVVGMGSGREAAAIHYWLTDEQGKKVFDHKDTIRAEFWGNAYASSVGELAHPFASKIADRLAEAKLY
jgi:hypothetical protein